MALMSMPEAIRHGGMCVRGYCLPMNYPRHSVFVRSYHRNSHLDPLYLTRRSPERHIETPLMALRDRNEYQHRALEPRAMQCRKMLLENGADPTISSSAWEHWSPIARAITHLTTGSLLESTVSSPVLSRCERHAGANCDEGLC